MNVSINQLVKSLLQKDSLEHCSLPELTAYAERNPYFGAAQLLLAKKLQTESPEKFEEQYQKTLLYFHNPLWVEHLLNETGGVEVQEVGGSGLEVGGSGLEVGGSRLEVGEVGEVGGSGLEVGEVQEVERLTGLHVDRVEEVEKEIVTDEVKIETGDSMNSFETAVVEEVRADVPVIPVPVPVPVEAVNPANDLVFEPYHTVDYFASQGIRINEEERPTDQFGKQLKSFTDWLKTLKRLPATELTKDIPPQSENKVEQLAGQSITDREVLTEAMAEVWEKQGNTLKATEIYRKLSLLEPVKSAYFAAKIEGLKKKTDMTTLFVILIIVVSAVLGLIVLVQNPKGGGLAGNVAGFSNQLMGVKQTTDVLEKGTWIFGGLIALLCVLSVFFISDTTSSNPANSGVDPTKVVVPAQQQAQPGSGLQTTPAPAPVTPAK